MKTKRGRINLSIDSEVLEFAKKWSYVAEKPISHIVEKMLQETKELIANITPDVYLSDPEISPRLLPSVEEEAQALDEWLQDDAEAEYCKKNPNSKRAKMRIILIKKRQEEEEKDLEEYEKFRTDFIKRWKEVFP